MPLTLVCNLAMAVLLNQNVRLRNFFRTVAFFPYVASLVAVAAVWNMIFNPAMGPINMLLSQLGCGKPAPMGGRQGHRHADRHPVQRVENMGYYMVIYLAGLQGCNPDLNEAAELDGANRWQAVLAHHPAPAAAHHLLCYHHADHLRLQGVRSDVHDHPGRPRHFRMTLVYYIYNGLCQHPEIRLRQRDLHGAVCSGADRHDHPVPRLQGRKLRKEERPYVYRSFKTMRPRSGATPPANFSSIFPHRHHGLYAAALFVDAVLLL